MYDLNKISSVIDHSACSKAVNQLDFDHNPDYVFSIVVHTVRDTVVKVSIANKVIEVGLSFDGRYKVAAFEETPFPYRLYPVIEIQCDCAFTFDYVYCKYDTILDHVLDQIGVYYKIYDGKYIVMQGSHIYVSNNCNIQSETYKKSLNNDYLVIECADFKRVVESEIFEWLKPFVMGEMSQKYTIIGVTKLGLQLETPGVIIEKNKADALIQLLRYHFPLFQFNKSIKTPDELISWNKKITDKIISYL